MQVNHREWRYFFNLYAARATGPSIPQLEELAVPLLKEVNSFIPGLFDDIYMKSLEWQSDKTSDSHKKHIV